MEDHRQTNYGFVWKALLQFLRPRLGWVLALGMLCAALGWGFCAFCVPARYEARVCLIVTTQTAPEEPITADGINAAKNLLQTCGVLLQSNTTLDQVCAGLDASISRQDLAEGITLTPIAQTQLLELTVVLESPQAARQAAERLVQLAPQVLHDALGSVTCKAVDAVEGTNAPVFPQTGWVVAASGILGVVLALAGLTLSFALHPSGKKERDSHEIQHCNPPV